MNATVHKLTNLDISEQYRNIEMYMMRKDFTGQFARWVVEQSPYAVPDIGPALSEFDAYIMLEVMGGEEVKKFTYDELNKIISEETFESLPYVLALNTAKVTSGPGYANRHNTPHPDYDFIDLSALARNIFYSIVRHHINWP
jgi:hypothetical protein